MIKITESELRDVISKSVQKILNESVLDDVSADYSSIGTQFANFILNNMHQNRAIIPYIDAICKAYVNNNAQALKQVSDGFISQIVNWVKRNKKDFYQNRYANNQ